MPFTFVPCALPGVVLIEPIVFQDERGFFMETYKASDFAKAGISLDFVQENHSRSVRGTLRGLHFQRAPRAQAKLVRTTLGEVFDVVVDVTPGSSTFGRWVSVALSAENKRSLYVPTGYAHGFCVVTAEAEVVYKTTQEYAPELELGVRWDDASLRIPWPISSPRLSDRDTRWPSLEHLKGALAD
jgi:dTDP-4-dehydrorhamnose 3,5-epimerase